LLREPYIFEFLKIPEAVPMFRKPNWKRVLCDHLQQFLLELGKGFTFVGQAVSHHD
jgi:predicted nuclease of restriction endonuclease-like (RecB) superfamily